MTRKPLFAGVVTVGAIAALAVGLIENPASAQVAAKVESQTRPNFGLLLDPPAARRGGYRHTRRWDWRSYYPGWRDDWRGPRSDEVALVDCDHPREPFAIERSIARLRPGGTLILRARGQACTAWLNVDKPIVLVGESGLDLEGPTPNLPVTLRAPQGQPCITVARGVRLEVRDVVFESTNAGDAACVVGYEADIVLNRVAFRHSGDESAVFADGGSLEIRNSLVDARTPSGAISAYGARLTASNVAVTNATVGIELTPGGEPSTIDRVSLRGVRSAPDAFGPRTVGLAVRALREQGPVTVTRTVICGYSEGVSVDGAFVEVRDSRICGGRKGAVLYSGQLNLTGNRIGASDYGLVAGAGRAVVERNLVYRVDRFIAAEDAASIQARGNQVYSRSRLCEPERIEHRWDGRGWGGRNRDSRWEWRPQNSERDGFACEYTPFPQQDWRDGEGLMGDPYSDYAYDWPQYDRHANQGYGWYDRDGQFTDDDRSHGDDRWGPSSPRRPRRGDGR